MTEPGDFGLSSLQALAHVGDPTPAPGHGPFWNRFAEEVWKLEPTLRPLEGPEATQAGGRGATHVVTSLGDVRIGCRLTSPEHATWGVVLLHGYSPEPAFPTTVHREWADGAVLAVRVRGFPGSCFDTGQWTESPAGWIAQGMSTPASSALRGAVADVVCAFRALRAHLGPEAPISLAGESFGGGLAVIAAAQLAGRDRVFRLALGLPSLGDWPWRFARPEEALRAGSLWTEAQRWIDAHPDDAASARDLLRFCDAVVHAPRVACPALVKLAVRDDVVPPPTAAAIFNALGASPGRKWRFLVERGHGADGGDDLRRHALFERLRARFVRPDAELSELMDEWSETLQKGVRAPASSGGATKG